MRTLSPFGRGAVGVASALGALFRPQRADLVAAAAEALPLSSVAIGRTRRKMMESEEGRRVLRLRPMFSSSVLEERCRGLPRGTLGGEWWAFMKEKGFSVDERPPVRFLFDEGEGEAGNKEEKGTEEVGEGGGGENVYASRTYVMQRYRTIHDLWHVLFELNTNLIGETALKVIEAEQLGLPSCYMAVVGGIVRQRNPSVVAETLRVLVPWAMEAGRSCEHLLSIHYEDWLEEEIDEVRRRWKIKKAPQGVARQSWPPEGKARQ